MPDLSLEQIARSKGYYLNAGVDEAGRGSLAGPVVAGAVILKWERFKLAVLQDIDDSKKITAAKRQKLFKLLPYYAFIGVGITTVSEIDEKNILMASMIAMTRAVADLPKEPDYVFVDGNRLPELSCPGEFVIKGDSRSFSIAAASIVAKVTRDNIMTKLAKDYPGYGWERNAGYGTPEHKKALARFGVTSHHRKTFAPIIKILNKS
jgi:ribonuclease HII